MKIKIFLTSILIGSIFFTSCEDFLEEVPYSFLSPENFYQSEADAETALIGVYSSLGNSGTFWNDRKQMLGFWCGDFGISSTGNANQHAFVDWSYNSSTGIINSIWRSYYASINRANAVIDNVTLMESGITDEQKNAIIGEAYFLRAMLYFDLVEMWGDVPLFLNETKTEEQAFVGPSSEAEVYAQIVEDLLFAKDNMPVYVRGSEAVGRADRAAAKALLGKVYLNMAGFPLNESARAADGLAILKELIAEKGTYGLGLHDNYMDAFAIDHENGMEDVFSIQFLKGLGAANTGSGSLLHIQFGMGFFPPSGTRRGIYMFKPTPRLIFSFLDSDGALDVNDERYQQLTTETQVGDDLFVHNNVYVSYTNPLSPDFHPDSVEFGQVRNRIISKFMEQEIYNENTSANDGSKNVPIIRWAEVLLLAAELENMVNGSAGAYQYLDEVRDRSNADLAPRGMSQTEMEDYILDERMRELHGEGQRFFDLKRTQKLLSETQEAFDEYGGVFQSSKRVVPTALNYYFPYPQTEIDFNPNLTQRDGY